MRLSDILGLRCNQVNLSGGIIDVIASKPGTYTAYLTKEASDMLRERLSEPSGLVFPSPKGGKQIIRAGKPFLHAVKACGFNDGQPDPRYHVVFHSLRHTYACSARGAADRRLEAHGARHDKDDGTLRQALPGQQKGRRKADFGNPQLARTRLLLRNACMSSCE